MVRKPTNHEIDNIWVDESPGSATSSSADNAFEEGGARAGGRVCVPGRCQGGWVGAGGGNHLPWAAGETSGASIGEQVWRGDASAASACWSLLPAVTRRVMHWSAAAGVRWHWQRRRGRRCCTARWLCYTQVAVLRSCLRRAAERGRTPRLTFVRPFRPGTKGSKATFARFTKPSTPGLGARHFEG
jgi:hypothetical protein